MKNMQTKDAVLLQAFTDRIRDELVDQAIATIRPNIKAAAEKAIEELKPTLQRHFDIRADELVFLLTMGDPPTTGRVP